MAKALSRKVTIYINGREVESTLKSLEGELAKLKTQQRNATIGSEEYIQTSLKIKELNSIINEQKKAVQVCIHTAKIQILSESQQRY